MGPHPDDRALLHDEADALSVVLRVLPGQALIRCPEERVLEEPPPGDAVLPDVLVVLVVLEADCGALEQALGGHAHQLRLWSKKSRTVILAKFGNNQSIISRMFCLLLSKKKTTKQTIKEGMAGFFLQNFSNCPESE